MNRKKQTKEHQQGKRRRRKGRYTLYYILFGLFAAAVGITLSLTVLFPVESILVEGVTKYPEEAIAESSGVTLGENLFRVETEQIRETLRSTYPYVEEVTVRRKLPDTLVIQVEEAVTMGSFLKENGYVLVSDRGRVLQVGAGVPPSGSLQVSGVELEPLAPCEYLPDSLDESMTMFRYLSEAVDETAFSDITAIDLSDRLNIRVFWQDRVRIELGSEGDLADKLEFAQYALENSVDEYFEGVLDVTIPGQIRLWEEEIHEEGYHEYHPRPVRPSPLPPAPEEGEGAEGEAAQPQSPETARPESRPEPQQPAEEEAAPEESSGESEAPQGEEPKAEEQEAENDGEKGN